MRRFEVSGWMLITFMTIALGVAVWAVARDQIVELIDQVL
jgi:hypothetical protein